MSHNLIKDTAIATLEAFIIRFGYIQECISFNFRFLLFLHPLDRIFLASKTDVIKMPFNCLSLTQTLAPVRTAAYDL